MKGINLHEMCKAERAKVRWYNAKHKEGICASRETNIVCMQKQYSIICLEMIGVGLLEPIPKCYVGHVPRLFPAPFS